MKNRVIWKMLALLVAIAIILGGTALFNSWTKSKEKGNNIFSLEIPSFIKTVKASELNGQKEGTSFLIEEAGISAYVNVRESIDIEKAETAFKSIETVNNTYIIGEINVTGVPEYAYPHAYIHEDGWIVAYYSKNAPASKIMQWNEYEGGTISTTTLEDAIHEICLAIEFPFSTIEGDIKYYDFENPNANRMMLIVETVSGDFSDSFNLEIPVECWLYEASWSHYFSGYLSSYYGEYSRIKIDGDIINQITGGESRTYFGYGAFTSDQLEVGVLHTISVEHEDGSNVSGVAVVLIYRTS